ncbi:MAG: cytochrome c [Flavobacterium sp.]|nr:cytochrome c [Flavobacterium sp.]
MITKLYLGIALMASVYLYYSDASSASEIKYLSIAEIQQQTPLQKSIANGKDVYADFCVQCHLANGKGDGLNIPPLDGSDWLKKKRSQIIHVVKYGQSSEIMVNSKKFNNIMPAPVGLSNQEVADVLNYVMNSWSNKNKKIVTADQVALVKP